MNAWLNYVGCGIVALSVLACGSKGEDGDDEETGGTSGSGGSSTGGTSSGGTSTGGTSTGGSAGSGPLPPMTTMSFANASDVCPNPPMLNMEGCWKLVDSNAKDTTQAIPDDEITYEHNPAEGEDEDGAFEATIPYTMPDQWVSFGINFLSQDLSNRIIRARVKIVSGLGTQDDTMPPGGTKVYAKSGEGYCYANGAYFNQGTTMNPIGEWNTIQFDLTQRPTYTAECTEAFSPSDIREIGVQFDSTSTAMDSTTAVVLIDNVEY